ncbi:hypothetical protein [Rhizobium sullae]|nr:hypothetical protein [Rhizobium sullae]
MKSAGNFKAEDIGEVLNVGSNPDAGPFRLPTEIARSMTIAAQFF